MRDDFTSDIKDTLARRVGMQCSNPACRKPTSGPRENASKAVNIGVACHITAASPGGPRYNSFLSTQERKSIENGIWLCQNCAKLIDSDEDRFTVDFLQEWKQQAEKRARLKIETIEESEPEKNQIRVLIVSAQESQWDELHKNMAIQDLEIIHRSLLPTDHVYHLDDADVIKLSKTLMENYDIIHFIVRVEPDGSLVLGESKVAPSELSIILDKRGIKCALFMTCNSANVIGALQATDISCTIASTSDLYIQFSHIFCQSFYSSLSVGFTFAKAFTHAKTLASRHITPHGVLHLGGELCIVMQGFPAKARTIKT